MMGIDDLTAHLIDEYVKCKGQEVLSRASLTPTDYLTFREQAAKECQYTMLSSGINVPSDSDIINEPRSANSNRGQTKLLTIREETPKVKRNEDQTKIQIKKEEKKDEMFDLLSSIPG